MKISDNILSVVTAAENTLSVKGNAENKENHSLDNIFGLLTQ